MQTPKFNQTLQQLDNKEANKGIKRPIEDLFSDQELLVSQEKKHKRLKRSPGNQPSLPKLNQEQNSWQIDVPKDNNSLHWSVALAYLIPVKDNDEDFKNRFEKLFGGGKFKDGFRKLFTSKKSDKLDKIKVLIRNYNPFFYAGDIYEEKC